MLNVQTLQLKDAHKRAHTHTHTHTHTHLPEHAHIAGQVGLTVGAIFARVCQPSVVHKLVRLARWG